MLGLSLPQFYVLQIPSILVLMLHLAQGLTQIIKVWQNNDNKNNEMILAMWQPWWKTTVFTSLERREILPPLINTRTRGSLFPCVLILVSGSLNKYFSGPCNSHRGGHVKKRGLPVKCPIVISLPAFKRTARLTLTIQHLSCLQFSEAVEDHLCLAFSRMKALD